MAPSAISPSAMAPSVPSASQRRFSSANGNTRPAAHALISQALQTRINGIDPDECEAGVEDAFFVADLGEVYRQHMRWKINLPRVEPFYGRCFYPMRMDIITNLH